MAGTSSHMARFVKLNANVSVLSSRTKALAAFASSTQRRTMHTATVCQLSTAGNYSIASHFSSNINYC